MTVKELIEELQKVENKNLKVVIQGIDPTDYIYFNEIEGIEVKNCGIDLGTDFIFRRRLVLDGGMF
jgi:hypothetical protein